MQVFQPDLYRSVPSNQKGRWGEDGGKWEKIETGTQMAFGGVADLYKAFAEGNNELLVDFEGAVKRHEMIEAIVRSSEKGTRETY